MKHTELPEFIDQMVQWTGSISSVDSTTITLDEPFGEFVARFAHLPGTVALLSGGQLDCARHHILGIDPWLAFKGRNGRMTITAEGRTFRFNADPFETLNALLGAYRCPSAGRASFAPLAAGLLGYLAYDLKDALEDLDRTTIDDLHLPQICWYAPSILVIHDCEKNHTRLCVPVRREAVDLSQIKTRLRSQPARSQRQFGGDQRGLQANFSRSQYEDAIRRIRDYIAAGDVYQVNMSQRFETAFEGDPYSLFQALYNRNPAPFFAFVNAGDHQIVSTSPERFILMAGDRVETRPIKGTRPRGKNPTEDALMRTALKQSPKDDAELSMIVDLLRNDIGKVCRPGSVRVTQHKRLEAYENVYHLVSVVEGRLDPGRGAVDLIRATFPGGSITGCPKVRAMEIIDELESVRRHIYTGAIGYVSFDDQLDLSIAIRTATVVGDRLVFSVGGGVVFDSDPGEEYEETRHKGQTLMRTFADAPPPPVAQQWVWFNGALRRQAEVHVSPLTLAMQYGYGFFETLRVDNGQIRFLKDHLERFNQTWKALFDRSQPDLTWEAIIAQVIAKNGLERQTAAVKIIAGRGLPDGRDDVLMVSARPYTERLAEKGATGLHLAVYPHPRMTPLAEHKTLNYLYYYLAGRWARANGADEAVILNPDRSISETHSANLLLVQGRRIIAPQSDFVLPGVMQKNAIRCLRRLGFTTERRLVNLADLPQMDAVLMTNALIGVLPVLSVDGAPVGNGSEICAQINGMLRP